MITYFTIFNICNRLSLIVVVVLLFSPSLICQFQQAEHGKRVKQLTIINAIMVDGVGIPAEGPVDIVLKNNRIDKISHSKKEAEYRKKSDVIIDAKDKYVLPGFINMHAHLMDSRAGQAMPFQYQYNLWLGAGITTIRDVGSDKEKALKQKRLSAMEKIIAPRMFLYMWFPGGHTAKEIRANVRKLKRSGADGIKFHQIDRSTFLTAADEAKEQGLKIAHHVGIKDATAWDDAMVGTSTIEHWYGIPDAALDEIQPFPEHFNHANELHRFRYAGRLWREANPEKLKRILQLLIQSGVAWDPTFCIYEACRDLQRAITQPWFKNYLHPALENFFIPNPNYHGSFFLGWTHTDEVFWKENYRIWMKAVKDFSKMGGIVTTGEDAGFIYQMFGFGYLRELELHEEAGFHPLEVIQHATYNSARILGKSDQLGRIKVGYIADLVIVNGNPLENLHVLFPKGISKIMDQQQGSHGGIEWTIKNGIPYHAPTLFEEVKEMVKKARQQSVTYH